mmetsp:Transcript_14695/g.44358  ORF Transcript_14695/g.44358 Transcript_14695/m.44358 type:complete len:789 (+) Transcript_14695:333-2699(+)
MTSTALESRHATTESGVALRPCRHQVAGHLFEEGKAGSLVDDAGHFYKPMQRGPRGDRELRFYELVKAAADECTPDLAAELARLDPFGPRPAREARRRSVEDKPPKPAQSVSQLSNAARQRSGDDGLLRGNAKVTSRDKIDTWPRSPGKATTSPFFGNSPVSQSPAVSPGLASSAQLALSAQSTSSTLSAAREYMRMESWRPEKDELVNLTRLVQLAADTGAPLPVRSNSTCSAKLPRSAEAAKGGPSATSPASCVREAAAAAFGGGSGAAGGSQGKREAQSTAGSAAQLGSLRPIATGVSASISNHCSPNGLQTGHNCSRGTSAAVAAGAASQHTAEARGVQAADSRAFQRSQGYSPASPAGLDHCDSRASGSRASGEIIPVEFPGSPTSSPLASTVSPPATHSSHSSNTHGTAGTTVGAKTAPVDGSCLSHVVALAAASQQRSSAAADAIRRRSSEDAGDAESRAAEPAPADASAAEAAATATPAGSAAAAVGAQVVMEQTAAMQRYSQAIKQAASSDANWAAQGELGQALQRQAFADQASLQAAAAGGAANGSGRTYAMPYQRDASFVLRNAPMLRCIPRYYGTVCSGDDLLLELEDVAQSYKRPSIIDIKVGFKTWYPGAEERYIAKCQAKDAATTQSKLGFKICGMQVFRHLQRGFWRASKRWCKGMSEDAVTKALLRFANNEAGLTPKDIYGGPQGAIAQLAGLTAWFAQQTEFCFYSSSVLIIYEGAATRTEDAHVSIRLVDFAHTFPSGGKPDGNFTAGARALLGALSGVMQLNVQDLPQ